MHGVLLPCCTSYFNDSKQKAMVSMGIPTFEPQVGLDDKLYICLLDTVR